MMLSTKFPIESDGRPLNGYFFMTEGVGPKPTALLLHGFPGHEKHFDIASALRKSGYNAIIFSYSGCWGSSGSYSFEHVLQDTGNVIAQMRNPNIQDQYRIDPEKIFLIGHSMGGWNALMQGARNSDLAGIVAMATFNLGYFSERLHNESEFKQTLIMGINELGTDPLSGTSAEMLTDEIESHYEIWDPRKFATELTQHPLFMIAATNDIYAPREPHSDAIVEALKDAGHSQLNELVFESDHSFSGQREKLIGEIIHWLDKRLKG